MEAYPTEISETYYIKAARAKNPGGKLHSQYINYQSRLAAVNLITRRNKSGVKEPPSNSAQNSEIQQPASNQSALEFVKGSNWDETLQFYNAWNETFNERQVILSKSTSLEEYLKTFPYLMDISGFELVRISLKNYYVF